MICIPCKRTAVGSGNSIAVEVGVGVSGFSVVTRRVRLCIAFSIGGGVLRTQVDFDRARFNQLLSFDNNVVHRTADLLATNFRDGAEGALVGTTLGDGEDQVSGRFQRSRGPLRFVWVLLLLFLSYKYLYFT